MSETYPLRREWPDGMTGTTRLSRVRATIVAAEPGDAFTVPAGTYETAQRAQIVACKAGEREGVPVTTRAHEDGSVTVYVLGPKGGVEP